MSTPAAEKLEQFRQKLKKDWTGDETVSAWRKWHAQIASFTRGVTEALLKEAQLHPGLEVLDLASGVGDPTLSIAPAVAPSGRVVATDLGPGMFSLAAELAAAQNLNNIEFREANAESLPFPDSSFDRVTCRFGAMFFPDLQKALHEALRVLKPSGRVCFAVWGKQEQPFFSATHGVLAKFVEIPKPDPDAPNAFRFAERGRIQHELETAGFQNVKEEFLIIPARWNGSLELYVQQFKEISVTARPLFAQLSPARRDDVLFDILVGLKKFVEHGHLVLPLEVVLASATR
jgi:ubiquinone/menaquinone biosynthesis C-methylase UbiE